MPPASRKRELLGRDADIGAPYPAVSHQLAQHKARGVGCNRKADTLGAHDQRRVDPDNLAMGGDERPTRIAGIERGIGLDHVVDQPPGARPQRSAERGNHTRCHRRLETERIADGNHQLAALEQFGIAERRRGQRQRGVDTHQGEVGIGVVPDHPCGQASTIDRGRADAVGVPDHVAVGEHEAVRCDHDA